MDTLTKINDDQVQITQTISISDLKAQVQAIADQADADKKAVAVKYQPIIDMEIAKIADEQAKIDADAASQSSSLQAQIDQYAALQLNVPVPAANADEAPQA